MFRMKALLLACLSMTTSTALAKIEAVWLTHRSSTPDKVVVNWKSTEAGPSLVFHGENPQQLTESSEAGQRTLHHVEIPVSAHVEKIHYRVETGAQKSEVFQFRNYPQDHVRVAVVADWGYSGRPDLTALKKDQPHVLMTAGDNVPDIINPQQHGDPNHITPYIRLFQSEPELFASTLFMPILGNHDKQVGPRLKESKAPAGASREIYDISASAYLSVFALPSPGWHWSFTIPQADVTFAALDLHHLRDFGTVHQTSHDHRAGSEQFVWYDHLTSRTKTGFLVTLLNADSRCRHLEKGAWHDMFSRGTIFVTGFGYYAERAVEANDFPYYNTCIAPPNGQVYRDPKAVICEPVSNYMLLEFDNARGLLTVDLKRLDGSLIDRQVYPKQAGTQGKN